MLLSSTTSSSLSKSLFASSLSLSLLLALPLLADETNTQVPVPVVATEIATPPVAVIETPKGAGGLLSFKVLIVDDLTPKPVPFQNFKIQFLNDKGEPEGAAQTLRTDETGSFKCQLPAGKYVVQNVAPLKFKRQSYEWKREVIIIEGQTVDLQLTGDDAQVKSEAFPAARQVAEEAKIYRAYVDSVATVEGEAGHGTGFLIDSSGLLLTNQHVVHNSKRLVVRFRRGLRVEAQLVASDLNSDIAIVRVHPSAVKDLPVIPLAEIKEGENLVTEGEKVLAIGSPISEEKVLTTGIISRVKDGIIISDININPGNSGGPLLNLAGEVIGLTTFGESAEQGGPGLSGIINISLALPTLTKAKLDSVNEKAFLSSEKLLPDYSSIQVPADLLMAAAQTDLQVPQLNAPSSFITRFYTPFILASEGNKKEREVAKKKDKRRDKQGANGTGEGGQKPVSRFYEASNAAVVIAVAPALMESKGSKTRGLFGAMLGVANTKKSFEFRHDFYDMELTRDGVRVEPLRRRRIGTSIFYSIPGIVDAKDAATAGWYSFDPAAFRPGAKLELKVKREFNTEKWDIVKISDELQANLYNQFAGYWTYAASKTEAR